VLKRIHVVFPAALTLFALLVSLPDPASGQSTFGAVVGAVSDPQKAMVPGAHVKLTEVETNVARTTLTNSVGTYEFVNINQGVYVIEVTHPGFAVYRTQEFQVPARQTVRIDAELRTATVQEALVVADSAPLVNTENPTVASAESGLQYLTNPGHQHPARSAEGGRQRVFVIRQPALPE
jgi:hypothetical protein